MTLSALITDEKQIIESSSLEQSTKVGQVYCYISSGPLPMIKIGKGKNGRQRMASWVREYPPAWRNGEVVFILDKMNQSTAETALHKFFAKQRVSSEAMREHLGIESWQRLPDGASEWFYCDTFVKNSFRSVGIDLVQIYKSKAHRDTEKYPSKFEVWFYTLIYRVNRLFRGLLGWTTLLITTILAAVTWGTWIPFGITILLGLYIAGLLFPSN